MAELRQEVEWVKVSRKEEAAGRVQAEKHVRQLEAEFGGRKNELLVLKGAEGTNINNNMEISRMNHMNKDARLDAAGGPEGDGAGGPGGRAGHRAGGQDRPAGLGRRGDGPPEG